NRTMDVTNDPAITWTTDNTSVASIVSGETSGNGIATGESVGSVTVTAEGSVNGVPFSDTATLTVTDAIITALEVTPTTETVPVGLSKPFTATAILSDGKTTIDVTDSPLISWTSSTPTTATIDASGLATGVEVGTVTVKAAGVTPEGTELSDTATLEVTGAIITRLQVTPTTDTTPKGLSKAFTATAIFSDGLSTLNVTDDPSISWSSSDVNTATINSGLTSGNGEATGVEVGTVTITAQGITPEGTSVEGTATLTVTDAIVTALQVTPPLETTPKGLTKAFTATALMSDGTNVPVTDNVAVSWSTSDSAFATITTGQVSGNGVATGEDVGKVTVIATGTVGGETFEGTAQLTVTNAVATSLAVTPADASVAKGLTQQYIATLTLSDDSTEDVTAEAATSWTSGSAATINAVGLAKGESVGEAQITASGTYDGVTLSDTQTLTVTAAEMIGLEVTPETAEIAKGRTQQFTAKAIFSDTSIQDVTTSTDISWVSSTNAASLSGTTKGLASGDNVGDTVITATYNGFSDTADLTVTAAVLESIEVTPNPIEVGIGDSGMLTAIGYYSDGTTPDITSLVDWTGQDISIATVDSVTASGLVTGVSEGITLTKATLEGVSSDSVAIHVVKSLISIAVTPTIVDIVTLTAEMQQLTAIGTYNDSTQYDLTNNVVWSVEDSDIVNISESGLVTKGTKSDGVTTAWANFNGIESNRITINACNTFAGPCIDVFDFLNRGKLYTSSPSVAYLDSIGGSLSSDQILNIGLNGPRGNFYLFTWNEANLLCDKYNEVNLAGRSNWRLPSSDELQGELYGTYGNMFTFRGWPTESFFYWSSTSDGIDVYKGVYLNLNDTGASSIDATTYVSCTSEP
ncbi:Ig-like domain-containing protein, partial [Vibrio parahaemolyticus]|uniref:Ig-like domain-containing protein n=1 Tax=Vibrio parahaemolyticus TaxID=670 RepID=UPI001E4E332E